MNRKNRIAGWMLIGCCIGLVSVACDKKSTDPAPKTNEELQEQFQTLLNNVVVNDNAIHSAVLMVEAPLRNLSWKGAAGLADPGANLAMDPDDQFRTASIGKMTCATLAMALVEAGQIGLDDSIHLYLPDSIMNGLHVFQGQDYSERITIRQLLSHTSGLPDYVEDGDANANGLPDFLELLMAQPNEFWTPEETIAYAKEHLTPFFQPGQGFHYSDTNYQLLGLILQNVTTKALNVLYRESLFSPLGMNYTYMEFYDTPIPGIAGRSLSHVYFGDQDYTNWISSSADWAGGGLASTTGDLTRFLRAFVSDGIFQNSQTKAQMMSWGSTGITGVYYGFGMVRVNFEELGLPGAGEIYGHDGFPQSFMYYWPGQNVTIAGTLNQAVPEKFDALAVVASVILLLQD